MEPELTQLQNDPLFDLVSTLDAVVYLVDPDSYEILYANKTTTDLFGNIEGSICWQVLQNNQSGPCSECPRKELLIKSGAIQPVIPVAILYSTNQHRFAVLSKALIMPDARLVRLQVATDRTTRGTDRRLCLNEEKFRTIADFTYDLESWIREDGTLEQEIGDTFSC